MEFTIKLIYLIKYTYFIILFYINPTNKNKSNKILNPLIIYNTNLYIN